MKDLTKPEEPTKTCDLCGAEESISLNGSFCESCLPLTRAGFSDQYRAAKRAVERTRKEAWEAGRDAAADHAAYEGEQSLAFDIRQLKPTDGVS